MFRLKTLTKWFTEALGWEFQAQRQAMREEFAAIERVAKEQTATMALQLENGQNATLKALESATQAIALTTELQAAHATASADFGIAINKRCEAIENSLKTLVESTKAELARERERSDSALARLTSLAFATVAPAPQQAPTDFRPPSNPSNVMDLFKELPAGDPNGYDAADLDLGDSYAELIKQANDEIHELGAA